MIAESGDLSIAVLIELDLSLHGIVVTVDIAIRELILESKGGIVGSEHFRGQILHALLQVFVEL